MIPVCLRQIANPNGKELAAKKAADLVNDGDTVLMDASTTVFRMCHYLKNKKHLKIITNNLGICQELGQLDNITVYCTGGTFVGNSGCFLGSYAEDFIRHIKADILFFSSQGISADGKITDVGEQEIAMRKVMLRSAKKKVFVCDSSKFGIEKPFLLCSLEDVDSVICDQELRFANAPESP